MGKLKIFWAAAMASIVVSANLTPPAFARSAPCTWDFRTIGKPIFKRFKSVGWSIRCEGNTGMPIFPNHSLTWYSNKSIDTPYLETLPAFDDCCLKYLAAPLLHIGSYKNLFFTYQFYRIQQMRQINFSSYNT
jgi:hypothetical protein